MFRALGLGGLKLRPWDWDLEVVVTITVGRQTVMDCGFRV